MADPNVGYRIEQTADGIEFFIPKRLQSANSILALLAALALAAFLIVNIIAVMFYFSTDADFKGDAEAGAIEKLYPDGYTYLMRFDSTVQANIREYARQHLKEYRDRSGKHVLMWWLGIAATLAALIALGLVGKPKIIGIREDGVVIGRKSFFPRQTLRGLFTVSHAEGITINFIAGLSTIRIAKMRDAAQAQMIVADLNSVAQRMWFHEN